MIAIKPIIRRLISVRDACNSYRARMWDRSYCNFLNTFFWLFKITIIVSTFTYYIDDTPIVVLPKYLTIIAFLISLKHWLLTWFYIKFLLNRFFLSTRKKHNEFFEQLLCLYPNVYRNVDDNVITINYIFHFQCFLVNSIFSY